tara:strand:- start:211 stop:393 length:183 start_codon:yes stop_codon:yes gene_type:complete
MSKRSKKKEEDIWEDYEPDGRDLAAHLRAQKEWKKRNPNFSMEDAADYYAELQGEIERGK